MGNTPNGFKPFGVNYHKSGGLYARRYSSENLPLFENRYVQGQTLIYICKNETCSLPVTTVEAAMGLMQ